MAAKAKTSSKTGSRTSTKTSTKKVSSKVTSSKEMPQEMSMANETSSMKNETMMNKKMGSKKTLLLLALAVVVLGLLYYYKSLFVVATVNGKPITRIAVISDLEKPSNRSNGKDALDNLITKELILEEAKNKGVSVTQSDIDAELAKIEDQLKTQGQTLDQALAANGLTKEDVSENLKVKLYIERILADKVAVSDDDAKKYFDENKASFPKDSKFDDQKAQIVDQLKQQKLQEEYQKWMDDLKANAKINYFKTY